MSAVIVDQREKPSSGAMSVVNRSCSNTPRTFRFHDLRHYLASLFIGSGLDVKVVQHRLRHGSAKTTLDT